MKYYVDINVSGFEDARTYDEIVKDMLQNSPAETEEEARKLVDEAIENGDLIEALPEDIYNEESEAAYHSAEVLYTENGTYIEVAVETFGTSFQVDFSLKNGEWVPGSLHYDADRVNLRGCELADVEKLAEDAAQEYMNDWERSFDEAFRAAYVMDSDDHRMLGWRWDPSLKYIDVLYCTEDGKQETYCFDENGYTLDGEHLGGADDFNASYGAPSEAEADGYQVPKSLRKNWLYMAHREA